MSGCRAPKACCRTAHRRLSLDGRPVFHYSGISSFAQFAVALPHSLVRIDRSVPLDVAAMFGCAVVTGAGAVFNSARLRPGARVAVIGLGGVGLNAVMAARLAGASQIIGIDINRDKFALAAELGCTQLLAADDEKLVETITRSVRRRGRFRLRGDREQGRARPRLCDDA